MKNLIICLCFLCIFSCKKTIPNYHEQEIKKSSTVNIDWRGDKLISDFNYIKRIDSSCKISTSFFNRSLKQIKQDSINCVLSKIKFDYSKLLSLKKAISIGKLDDNVELIIKNSPFNNGDNLDLNNFSFLYLKKNGKLLDSIKIFQSINYSEALVVKTRYYYVDNDNVYLLDFVDDESGSTVNQWNKYKIDTKLCKLFLEKHNELKTKNNKFDISKTLNHIWQGNYYFEASNKDNIKTKYNIIINSLDNVTVQIKEDNTENNYVKINAEPINKDKIKIVFNPQSENDMGTIYIEKSDNKYLISGNPIYFINPGNNEMSLKKIK